MKNKLYATIYMFGGMAGCVVWLLFWCVLALLGVQKAFLWAAMTGVIVAFAVMVWLFSVLKSEEKRYAGIEQTIAEPIALRVNANVSVGDVSRNGYLYLTEQRLICYFRDRAPYTKMAFLRASVHSVRCLSDMVMEITQSGHAFEIVCADMRLLAKGMRSLGWRLTEAPEGHL